MVTKPCRAETNGGGTAGALGAGAAGTNGAGTATVRGAGGGAGVGGFDREKVEDMESA